jgi:hypothetical protein
MDVKQLLKTRNDSLKEFEDTYNTLKVRYNSLILSAIQEEDAASQQTLIQEILDINAELTAQLRTILSEISSAPKGFDVKTLDQLTAELVEYQKQHQELTSQKDRLTTLKLIASSTNNQVVQATMMYWIYLISLILAMFVVAFLAFRLSITSAMSAIQSSVASATQ